jgi:hypothetical protein
MIGIYCIYIPLTTGIALCGLYELLNMYAYCVQVLLSKLQMIYDLLRLASVEMSRMTVYDGVGRNGMTLMTS